MCGCEKRPLYRMSFVRAFDTSREERDEWRHLTHELAQQNQYPVFSVVANSKTSLGYSLEYSWSAGGLYLAISRAAASPASRRHCHLRRFTNAVNLLFGDLPSGSRGPLFALGQDQGHKCEVAVVGDLQDDNQIVLRAFGAIMSMTGRTIMGWEYDHGLGGRPYWAVRGQRSAASRQSGLWHTRDILSGLENGEAPVRYDRVKYPDLFFSGW